MIDYHDLFCDVCLTKVEANPDTPLSELLCDRCIAKLEAYFDALFLKKTREFLSRGPN